jgi:MFS family permease
VPLTVYTASLESAISYWDTGESQVVPWIFGIAHPTGFPAFTIAAGIFAHVFAIGTVAWRIAFFSAIAMSAASWAIFRALRELRCDTWIALGAGWVFAFGEIAWTRGTRAEVHALAACLAALTIYFSVRWYERGEHRAFVLGALCWGLAIATHPIAGLLAPALLVVLFARRGTIRLRSFALALLMLSCGLALYAYLPIRSAMVTQARLDPTLALGDPPGKAFWDMNHTATWDGFKHFLSGSDFGVGGAFAAAVKWQTYRDGVPPFLKELWREITAFGLLLTAGGMVALFRRSPWLAAALFLAAACPAIFAFGYPTEADLARYYLIPFLVAAILAGYGASAIARASPELRAISMLLMPAIAVTLLIVNRDTFQQPSYTGAAELISTIVASTPDDAVLLAPWIDSTALAYAAYVDHSLGHRIVDSAWLSDEAARVPGWMRQGRHVYVVDQVFGSVTGYRLIRIPGSPDLFRVAKE